MCVTCLLTHFFQHQLPRHLGSAQRFETKPVFECKHPHGASQTAIARHLQGPPISAPGAPELGDKQGWTCPGAPACGAEPSLRGDMYFLPVTFNSGLKRQDFKPWESVPKAPARPSSSAWLRSLFGSHTPRVTEQNESPAGTLGVGEDVEQPERTRCCWEGRAGSRATTAVAGSKANMLQCSQLLQGEQSGSPAAVGRPVHCSGLTWGKAIKPWTRPTCGYTQGRTRSWTWRETSQAQ